MISDVELNDHLKGMSKREKKARIREILAREGWYIKGISKEERLRIVKVIAIAREGKCFDTKYINSYTKIEWECKKGHRWWTTVNSVIYKGTWCLKCSGKAPHNLKYLYETLREHNIELLDTNIKKGGMLAKYLVRCLKCEYKWEVQANSVINNDSGCPNCAGSAPLTYEILYKRFGDGNIRLLDKEYNGIRAKYLVRCLKCEYEWRVQANDVINRHSGCPNCRNKTEHTIRVMIEWATGHKFPHHPPRKLKDMGICLKNTRGNCMELDGYCPKLVISPQYPRGTTFEYHGEYHSNVNSHIYKMKRDPKAFKHRQQDDKLKKEQYKEQGILLIEVWGDDDIVYPNFSKIYDELIRVLKEKGIETDRPNMSDTAWMLKIYRKESSTIQTPLL